MHNLNHILNQILTLAHDNYMMSLIIGFFAAMSESFFPPIPLIAIITFNAAVLGFIPGFLASWLGSCTGTLIVYLLLSKIMNNLFMKRLKPEKVEKFISKVEKNEFKFVFLFYALPFLPSSLITLTAAYCKVNYKNYIPPMIFGKFVMIFSLSYIGGDIQKIIHQPVKIVVAIVVTLAAYLVSTKMKNDIENHEDEALEKYKQIKTKIEDKKKKKKK